MRFVIILVIGIHSLNAQTPAMQQQEFARIVDSISTEYGIIGVVTGFFNEEEMLNIHASGVKVHNGSSEMEISDKMHLGSNSKAMTGFVAAKMVEEGLISWDTKFLSLFPEMKKNANKAYKNITLQDLLSHTARVQPFTEDHEFDIMYRFRLGEDVVMQRKVWSHFLLRQSPVKRQKGSHFVYSNAGYTMAALMMEKISGKGWEELI